MCCAALLIGTTPMPLAAQTPVATTDSTATTFTVEQLDALLAPVALYPDELLAQVLMATTFPLQVVEAGRWVEVPANKALTGEPLARALAQQSWDPSVKSLVPFPQILAMLNSNLDWLQQVGYAMGVQQTAVWDSVQRLRRQAQAAGQCQSNAQQVVRTEGQTIIIAPAQPDVVYVPTYNPTVVYGAWPYPVYPPVYLPPPPGYYVGSALVAGLVFGAGVAITAGLWGWARPNWGYGNTYVNVNRYNTINVNRPPIRDSNWRPGGPGYRPGGGGFHPPPGPVGPPGRPGGFPANGIGRPNVSVPGGVVRPPGGIGQGNHPPIGQGGVHRPGGGQSGTGQGGRPGGGAGAGQGGRPGGGQGFGQQYRPSGGQGAGRPGGGQGARPSGGGGGFSQGGGRSPGAFSGTHEGRSAAQFGNRGAQSRQSAAPQRGGFGGGGGAPRGGGGGGGRGGGEHRR